MPKTDDASNASRVDLARAEFGRWMTGIDSRRSASQRFQVLRRDGEAYDEISVHPSIQEARDVCSREAWKAAFQAADARALQAGPVPSLDDVRREARRQGMEEAAQIAEYLRHPDFSSETQQWIAGTADAAEAIRAAAAADPVPETTPARPSWDYCPCGRPYELCDSPECAAAAADPVRGEGGER